MAGLILFEEGRRSSPGDALVAPAQRERRTPCRGLFGQFGAVPRPMAAHMLERSVLEGWSARLNRVPVLP